MTHGHENSQTEREGLYWLCTRLMTSACRIMRALEIYEAISENLAAEARDIQIVVHVSAKKKKPDFSCLSEQIEVLVFCLKSSSTGSSFPADYAKPVPLAVVSLDSR